MFITTNTYGLARVLAEAFSKTAHATNGHDYHFQLLHDEIYIVDSKTGKRWQCVLESELAGVSLWTFVPVKKG